MLVYIQFTRLYLKFRAHPNQPVLLYLFANASANQSIETARE